MVPGAWDFSAWYCPLRMLLGTVGRLATAAGFCSSGSTHIVASRWSVFRGAGTKLPLTHSLVMHSMHYEMPEGQLPDLRPDRKASTSCATASLGKRRPSKCFRLISFSSCMTCTVGASEMLVISTQQKRQSCHQKLMQCSVVITQCERPTEG